MDLKTLFRTATENKVVNYSYSYENNANKLNAWNSFNTINSKKINN